MYKSVLKEESCEITIKKSIFIANLSPVSNEEEAESFISKIREEHPQARHHCYAYIIGEDRLTQKYSDDGEPQGTAGMPILDILRKKELTDVVVVVTRYFGGILLGASGLVRAYSESCNEVTQISQEILKKEFLDIMIKIDYNNLGKFLNYCEDKKLLIHEKDFLEMVNTNIYVPKEYYETFRSDLMNITSGKALMEVLDEVLIDTIGDKLYI